MYNHFNVGYWGFPVRSYLSIKLLAMPPILGILLINVYAGLLILPHKPLKNPPTFYQNVFGFSAIPESLTGFLALIDCS